MQIYDYAVSNKVQSTPGYSDFTGETKFIRITGGDQIRINKKLGVQSFSFIKAYVSTINTSGIRIA